MFVTIGWRRSGFDFNDVIPVIPHVFERDNVESCFNELRDCVRVVGGVPDEHRLLFDDMEILSKINSIQESSNKTFLF